MSPPIPRRLLFLLSSSRRDGNAELLARRAASLVPEQVEQQWINLSAAGLPTFVDLRHDSIEAWQPKVDDAAVPLLEATLAATDIVMVAPVYWYSLPTAAKLYLDHWTLWLRAPGWDFRAKMAGKRLWAISVASERDPRFAEPLLHSLQLTADYMKMPWGGFLLGFGNRPGDVLEDAQSVEAADRFFCHLNSGG